MALLKNITMYVKCCMEPPFYCCFHPIAEEQCRAKGVSAMLKDSSAEAARR